MIRNIFLLMLSALCAWSCTDNLPGDEAPTDGRHSLNITVGPKPAFTDGTLTRADGTPLALTRAVQTDEGTKWEEGDVVWLRVVFGDTGGNIKTCNSALKYTGGAWRYLTEDEAAALGVSSYAGFNRTLTYDEPDGSIRYPHAEIFACYVGNGKPDTNGLIEVPLTGGLPSIPVMQFYGSMRDLSGSLKLDLSYICSRLRIPAEYGARTTGTYVKGYQMGSNELIKSGSIVMSAQSADTDVFPLVESSSSAGPAHASLTKDGALTVSDFLLYGSGSFTGNDVYGGFSYTLPVIGNGEIKPGNM